MAKLACVCGYLFINKPVTTRKSNRLVQQCKRALESESDISFEKRQRQTLIVGQRREHWNLKMKLCNERTMTEHQRKKESIRILR